MRQLNCFLDLTNLKAAAKIEYEVCAVPEYTDASF